MEDFACSYWFPEENLTSISYGEYRKSTKTEEEIRRFLLDEQLSPVKKSMQIISRGQQVQKYSVYKGLPEVMKEPDAEEFLLPLIYEEVPNQSDEIQILAGKSLVTILQNDIINRRHARDIFGLTVIMLKIWSKPVLDEWILVFDAVQEWLSYEILEKECVQIITSFLLPSQPAFSKYVAARMIGFIASKNRKLLAAHLCDKARKLCQDVDVDVRKVMAKEVLYKICISMGTDYVEAFMVEKLMELIYDSDIIVKTEGVRLIFSLIHIYTQEMNQTRIVNLFMDMMNSSNEEVQKVMSGICGQVLASSQLGSIIIGNHSQVTSFLSNFKEFGSSKNNEIRKNFCYNIPGVLFILGIQHFESLHEIYIKALTKDPSQDVRKCALSGMCEIIKMLGPQSSLELFLKPTFKFLKMEICPLTEKLVQYLSRIIEGFYIPQEERAETESMEEVFEKLFEQILSLMERLLLKSSWKLLKDLLKALSEIDFMRYWTYDMFAKMLRPILFNIAKEGSEDCKKASVNLLVMFLRRIFDPKKRHNLSKTIYEDFLKSQNYKNRIVYLTFVECCLNYLTREGLRLYIFPYMFSLADDKVFNVKKKFTDLLGEVYPFIKLEDDQLLSKVNEAMRKLSSEKSSEIKEGLRKLQIVMKESIYTMKTMEKLDSERLSEEIVLQASEIREAEHIRRKMLFDDIDLYNKHDSPKSAINLGVNIKRMYIRSANKQSSLIISNGKTSQSANKPSQTPFFPAIKDSKYKPQILISSTSLGSTSTLSSNNQLNTPEKVIPQPRKSQTNISVFPKLSEDKASKERDKAIRNEMASRKIITKNQSEPLIEITKPKRMSISTQPLPRRDISFLKKNLEEK